MNPRTQLMLNSVLVALLYGFKELAITIEESQGLIESSLNLSLGDMRKLFDEACVHIETINEEAKVQD